MTLGLDPFLLSLALTIPLLISVIISPWVGYYSDHFYSRFGRRKPFIVVASIICGIIYGFMWQVPVSWPETWQFTYLFILSLIFFTSSAFLSIPLQCLVLESSEDIVQRTKVIAITTFFRKICNMTGFWIYPLAQMSFFGGAVLGVQTVGWIVGLGLITIVSLIAAKYSHEAVIPEDTPRPKANVVQYVRQAIKNDKFMLVLIISFIQVCGGAFAASMDYYVLVYYVSAGSVTDGAILKGVLSSSHATMGMILIPVFTQITLKYGQKKALQIAFTLATFGGIAKWFIFSPGAGWFVGLDALLANSVWIVMGVTIPAIISVICDMERQETGEDNKGVYMAVHHWVLHLGSSVAALASGYVLSSIGFNALLGADQPADSILIMRLILSLGTTIFAVAALLITRKLQL